MTTRASRFPFSLDPLIAEAKQRARRRRLLLAAALALVAAGTATGVIATRSPAGTSTPLLATRWQNPRTCPDGGMALTANKPPYGIVGIVGAPSVSMSLGTASSIADRTGRQELQPAGTHSGTPRSVPCNVAANAAGVAGNTWNSAHRKRFAIRAGWAGYAGGPMFRFRCVLRSEGPRRLVGTCAHKPSLQAGAVEVRFAISRR
jgi:hypothetical protein